MGFWPFCGVSIVLVHPIFTAAIQIAGIMCSQTLVTAIVYLLWGLSVTCIPQLVTGGWVSEEVANVSKAVAREYFRHIA
jgi:hypothetical protein